MRRRQRSAQHLIWRFGVMGLVECSNQLRKKGRPEARAFPSVRMQRRRPRTSSHIQVSEIGAATACEPEPQTIHITDTSLQGVVHSPEHVGRCSSYDGGNQRGGKGAGYVCSLGGGRTLASTETKEGDLKHRRRTGNPSTGRGNTIRQKRRNCNRVSTQLFLTVDGSG